MNLTHFDVREAATYTGLGVGTLNKLRVNGGGPSFFKIGRAVRYNQKDLDAWFSGKKVSSTSDYKRDKRSV